MQPSLPDREPETLALRRLQSVMAEAEAALARRMRMHPTDIAAMAYLGFARGPIGPGDLAHRLDLSPAAATELVDRLTTAGHVERHRDLSDRRRIRLEPSAEAISSVLGHIAALIGALDETARSTPREDREAVLGFLERATATYAQWADPGQD